MYCGSAPPPPFVARGGRCLGSFPACERAKTKARFSPVSAGAWRKFPVDRLIPNLPVNFFPHQNLRRVVDQSSSFFYYVVSAAIYKKSVFTISNCSSK